MKWFGTWTSPMTEACLRTDAPATPCGRCEKLFQPTDFGVVVEEVMDGSSSILSLWVALERAMDDGVLQYIDGGFAFRVALRQRMVRETGYHHHCFAEMLGVDPC